MAQDASAYAAEPAKKWSDDAFLNEALEELRGEGFHTWPAYSVAGLRIDIVIERSGASVGVDPIGGNGESGKAFALERYRMYQRAGLILFPLPYSKWREDKQACISAIHRWINQELARKR